MTGPGFSFRHLLKSCVRSACSCRVEDTQPRHLPLCVLIAGVQHISAPISRDSNGISNSRHLMGQGAKWTRQRVDWALQKGMRVSLCAVRDMGTGRSAHTSDSKWSPWWQLHCLRWLVTPNLVLSYSQIALHMLVSFSLKAEHTSHLWISQLPLSMRKTKKERGPQRWHRWTGPRRLRRVTWTCLDCPWNWVPEVWQNADRAQPRRHPSKGTD